LTFLSHFHPPKLTDKRKLLPKERRELVSDYLIHGYPEKKIAEEIGVSIKTIVRDVRAIKDESSRFLRKFSIDEYLYLHKMAIRKIQDYEYRLDSLLPSANTQDKIRIIKELQENVQLQVKIMVNPMVGSLQTLLKVLDEKIERYNELGKLNSVYRNGSSKTV